MTEDKEQKISEKIRRYLKNTKNYLAKKTERTAQILKKLIRKCRKKSSWVNIPVLLTNITSLLVFCSMSYMLAEYEVLWLPMTNGTASFAVLLWHGGKTGHQHRVSLRGF